MKCAFCETEICRHGSLSVSADVVTCSACGAVACRRQPPVYCLPTYEGRVCWESDVFSTVCKKCHDSAVAEHP